ncbi:MAG: hypothetical protein RIQ71_877 [Verrucomicrobiota bacterium]|jgi:hypothetical protein
MKSQQGPIENIIDGLEAQSSQLSTEELAAELKEDGIDVDGLVERVSRLIADHRKRERLRWMEQAKKNRDRFAFATSALQSWLERPADEIIQAFKQRARSGEMALAFRNLGDLTPADMARILDAEAALVAQEKPAPDDT